jgi:hypothetical protein
MKKFVLALALAVATSGLGFSQMMGMQPYGYYYQPMMPMMMPMMMGGMGMMMMHDPEVMKIIREHQMQCRRELMKKLASRPTFIEKVIHIMIMNPEAVRETLKKNPELKEKIQELLR